MDTELNMINSFATTTSIPYNVHDKIKMIKYRPTLLYTKFKHDELFCTLVELVLLGIYC